jgi:large subunit ribosomal protein L23
MAIFDILKKKKPVPEKKEKAAVKKSEPRPKAEKKEKIKTESPEAKVENVRLPKVIFGRTYKTLKTPHVSEKVGDLAENNQYVFRVFPATNKIEIKRAVEESYGVKVVSIRIVNVPEKKRRLGKIQGKKPGYKKAIIKIAKGQKIEVLPR